MKESIINAYFGTLLEKTRCYDLIYDFSKKKCKICLENKNMAILSTKEILNYW